MNKTVWNKLNEEEKAKLFAFNEEYRKFLSVSKTERTFVINSVKAAEEAGFRPLESFDELKEVVRRLRAEDGCPWDREQTHGSLKAPVIEEAAEVICGINIYEQTGNAENLKEELGDLLLQVIMQAQIAEEEGIFSLDDVVHGITEKMIRRHPHVFGNANVKDAEEVLVNWEEIKKKEKEKAGKEEDTRFLADAFDEAQDLIERARRRKGLHT